MTDLQRLFSDLIRFETELWNAVDARLRSDFDLPMSRFEPMQVIAHHQPCRVYDIAHELSITVGGTSKLINRIEASGYCLRRVNPADHRSSIIELTAAGREIFAAATAAFDEELQIRLGSALSARALSQLQTTLTRLRSTGADIDMKEGAPRR